MTEPTTRRLPDLLTHYWDGIKGSRALPNENDVHTEALEKLGCWKDCFLIHVREIAKEKDYTYHYLGPSIITAYGEDLTGVSIRSFTSQDAPNLEEKYFEVIATVRPVINEGEFENARNMMVRYRQCLVPLGNEEGKVQAILGAMRYRLYPGG